MGLRVCALLVFLAGPAAGGDLILVSQGNSSYEIVRAEAALPSVHLAARELAHFIERSTGVRLPVVGTPTPGKKHVFVGPHASFKPEGMKPEGFCIKTVGEDLHIVGADTRGNGEQVKRTQPVLCGTLFGVYEFLERQVGVVFAWHDELGTVVPSLKEIRFGPIDLTQAPDWSTRSITDSPSKAAGLLFGRRLRLGASIQTDYTHNWHRILPVDKYANEHPEYAAEIDGKRRTTYYSRNHGGQVCTTNPAVIEHFAQAAIDWFNKNPADEVFPMSPNDGKGFCECGPCRALDPPVTGLAPNLSDRIMTFYNAVGERVARLHPKKKLGVFVYAKYASPPRRVMPHPSLALTHAPNSGYTQGMGWKAEHDEERAWVGMSPGMVKYDIYYYAGFGGLYLPAPVTAHLVEKLRAEHQVGFRGGYLYMGPSYELLGAGHYLMARLMWDRNADVEALEKRYYDALYGAAGKEVLEYYRLLESRLRRTRLQGIDVVEPILPRLTSLREEDEGSSAYIIAAYWPILDESSRILERARALATSPEQRERLARLQDHHDLLLGTVRGLIAAGRIEDQAQIRREDLAMYRAAIELREAARTRLRVHAPTLSSLLDGDTSGGLSFLDPKGALHRLSIEKDLTAAPVPLLHGDCEDLTAGDAERKLEFAARGGATMTLKEGGASSGSRSIQISVPADGVAELVFETPVQPGALYRLSFSHRSKVKAFLYDHYRQAPLVQIHSSKRRRGSAIRCGVPVLEEVAQWKRFQFIFEAPAAVETVRLSFSYPLAGAFDLDDVRLERFR